MHRETQRVQTVLEPELTHTVLTYQTDLDLANPSVTGLKRNNVLNQLSFYHITHNIAPDIMHDILESIGPYKIKLILNALINKKKYESRSAELYAYQLRFFQILKKLIKP